MGIQKLAEFVLNILVTLPRKRLNFGYVFEKFGNNVVITGTLQQTVSSKDRLLCTLDQLDMRNVPVIVNESMTKIIHSWRQNQEMAFFLANSLTFS